MASDSWMREFGKDPECDPDTMPPGVKDEFKRRLDEVDPDAKSRSWKAPAQMAMSIVVQRCVSGRVSISGKWQESYKTTRVHGKCASSVLESLFLI